MPDPIQIHDMTSMAKRATIPISVLIEVSYTCNEHCVHCCIDDHSIQGMTLAQYDTLFDDLARAGTFFVLFSGGDPFTRDDFIDIVRSARKRRLSVTIFTNGTLLSQDHIDELKELHIQEIHISIYSTDSKIHDAITQVQGSWEKSILSIRRLKQAGMNAKIKCPLMNTTADGVEALTRLATELNVSIQFTTIITAQNNGNKRTHGLRLTPTQLSRLLADPRIEEHSDFPVHIRENLACFPCDTILNGGAIDPLGNVYPCNQWRVSGGNVQHKSFGEIWKSSTVFQELRAIRLNLLKDCKKCDLFSYCTRCPGLALLEDGNMYGCSSAAKSVAEVRRELGIYPTQSHIFSTL